MANIRRVKNNTKNIFKEIAGPTTEKAVYALLSQGAALAATMTPVDTSTLINSQYAPQIEQSNGTTVGHVGYTAEYAKWVHDAPGILKGQPRADFGKTSSNQSFGGGTGVGNYWDPAGEPKFLDKGMQEVALTARATLEKHYRVKQTS